MFKKFIITISTFIGVNIISFYYYFFLLAMLALSTDSGTNSQSVYILKDFSFLFIFSLFIGCIAIIPHLITLSLFKKSMKKDWFFKKLYICLTVIVFLFCFGVAFSIHGSFSKEVYNERVLEIKEDKGFITDRSYIYNLCTKYLEFDNEKEIRTHIKKDKISLDKDFDEIVGRIHVITNTDFNEIYNKLNINKTEIIRENPQREMILNVFNDFENNKLNINEFKNELNIVLQSKIKKQEYNPNQEKYALKISIETDLVYLNMNINSKNHKGELDYINWLTESLKIWLEDEYDYNSKLVNSEIYKDYMSMLSKYNSLEDLQVSIQNFSEKYDLNYKNEVTNEILDNLYLGI